MANIEMGDTPNITAAERFLFLSALGLGAPYDIGSVSDALIAVDYAKGPVQKLDLVFNTAPTHTINPLAAVEGSELTLYIWNPYGNHPNLAFGATIAIASSISTAFPKHLEGGTYIAELVCVAGGTWFLKSFEEVIVKGPTLYFKGTTDPVGDVWNSLGFWFLDADATQACPAIPWTSDNVYKNSTLELATGNLATQVATGSPGTPLYLGQNFTIRGVANFNMKLEYATIIGGSFQNVTTLSHCTVTNSVIKMTADAYWADASTYNNVDFTFTALMFYYNTVNGGVFKCLSTIGSPLFIMGSTINAGYWDMTSGVANPIAYDPATGLGFLPRY